jgi:deoxyribonuclease-1
VLYKNAILSFLLLTIGVGSAFSMSTQQSASENYLGILPVFWSKVYANGGETLYCGRKFGSNKGDAINVEHVFPMSWVMKELRCRSRTQCRRSSPLFNRIEADMHNLYPSVAAINEARGAMGYSMVLGEHRRYGACDFEVDKERRKVEPRRKVRGDIARAMFYMQDAYGLKIFKRQGELLKKWHREDPPDAEEQRRNNLIEQLQGNRNRFIDHPESAKKLKF